MAKLKIVMAALLWAAIFASAAQATLTLYHGRTVAQAEDGIDGYPKYLQVDHTLIPTVPDPFQQDVFEGDTSSKNTLKWSVVGGQTIFSFDTSQLRSSIPGSYAELSTSEFVFETSETTTFELSGFFNVIDAGENESGAVLMELLLLDNKADEVLTRSNQISIDTPNEQFTLGEQGGDFSNESAGDLVGTIVAGHTIWLSFRLAMATNSPDSGANGIGNITLKIGTIPEPSSFALCFAFAILGLICRRQAG